MCNQQRKKEFKYVNSSTNFAVCCKHKMFVMKMHNDCVIVDWENEFVWIATVNLEIYKLGLGCKLLRNSH